MQKQELEFLRFSTAGSVDDGKSTLIGRLLHDSKNVYEDHLATIRNTRGSVEGEIDWALLTDGLKAEREQGITIDVAYRYFSTPKRKYIIADTPGHEQYTRNMATGASTADLTIVLIDARKGVLPQSKRHAFIASLLRIPHMVVAINKMDLVDYSREVFETIKEAFSEFAAKLSIGDLRFIPISALKGDNVVTRGENMPWYGGESLLDLLDGIHIASDRNLVDLRFPIQYVSRPNLDFRGFCGQVASGILRKGDEVLCLPSMKRSRVKSIVTFDGELEEAFPPLSVTATLEDEIDISRGDMLVHLHNRPQVGRHFEAMVVWMDEKPLDPHTRYYLKQTSRTTLAGIGEVRYRVNVNTLHREQAETLAVNEIGRLVLIAHKPITYDPYQKNRATGNFILIDAISNKTAAAGMIIDREPTDSLPARMETSRDLPLSKRTVKRQVSRADRIARLGQTPFTLWLTGMVSAGKSEIAFELERRLFQRGGLPMVLRGGDIRRGISNELSFSNLDIAEHLRRAAETARLFNEAGLVVLGSFVSPIEALREQVRRIIGPDRFLEVFVKAPLAWCRERDETGLYAQAEAGDALHLPGVTSDYEPPSQPDMVLAVDELGFELAAERVLDLIDQVFGRRA